MFVYLCPLIKLITHCYINEVHYDLIISSCHVFHLLFMLKVRNEIISWCYVSFLNPLRSEVCI